MSVPAYTLMELYRQAGYRPFTALSPTRDHHRVIGSTTDGDLVVEATDKTIDIIPGSCYDWVLLATFL